MQNLFLVYQEHGGPWDWSKGLREQSGFAAHAAFVDELVARDVIVLGGPLDEKEVLLIVTGDDEAAVRAYFAEDPWVKNGMLAVTAIRPWTVLLDGTRSSA
jgi:uncharacterized protein YciI